MHVERNRRARGVGVGKRLFEIVRAEIFLPHGRGGIARVARSRAVVAREKIFRDVEAFACDLKFSVGFCHCAMIV